MDGHTPESDGTQCFSHGLAHLILEHGYEKAMILAGQTLLDLLNVPGSDERPRSHSEETSGEESTRQFTKLVSGTGRKSAWGVRPSVTISPSNGSAGPTVHRDQGLRKRGQTHDERASDGD